MSSEAVLEVALLGLLGNRSRPSSCLALHPVLPVEKRRQRKLYALMRSAKTR
jgi:hypothetical protein